MLKRDPLILLPRHLSQQRRQRWYHLLALRKQVALNSDTSMYQCHCWEHGLPNYSWCETVGGDGKKGGHTATPHPAKQSGKTPASGDKSKQQTPKSAGSVACKSCSKYVQSSFQCYTSTIISSFFFLVWPVFVSGLSILRMPCKLIPRQSTQLPSEIADITNSDFWTLI